MVGWMVGFRALCSEKLRTPPGPEGSNGSGLCRVPQITRSPLRPGCSFFGPREIRLAVLGRRVTPLLRLKAYHLS